MLCCNGVFGFAMLESEVWMSPNSVWSAVAITIPVAVPCVTNVPMKTMFLRSVTGREWPGGGSGMTSSVLVTGSFSPVREDSSISRSTAYR